MGELFCRAGIQTAPTSSPVPLLQARSIAPRGRPRGVVIWGPIITSVFVTSKPTPDVPACPVFAMFSPRNAGGRGCSARLNGPPMFSDQLMT
jgi:hypothetical protein